MTRLEQVAERMNEIVPSEAFADDFHDMLKEFLEVRNDFMAARLPADHAVTMQAAARSFDSSSVEETTSEYSDAFINAFGNPVEEFNRIMAGLHGSKEVYAHR